MAPAAALAKPDPVRNVYLGYRDRDRDTPFGAFYQPEMAPLPGHVVEALHHGPQSGPTLLAFGDARTILDEGYHHTENGYGVLRDGSIHVSVRADMPDVTPPMWSWWFGWHGCDSRRYKLWHPRAHVYAAWNDGDDAGRRGRQRYIGRTSFVDEYIGSTLSRVAIQFVAPAALGLDPARLTDESATVAVCARLGSSDLPVDVGWFVHHVRATTNGSEMRSRFWLGRPHIAPRNNNRFTSFVRPVAARKLGVSAASARDLMVHCAQEMNHLAGFLPALYERFGDQ
jgi:hypothetical protein